MRYLIIFFSLIHCTLSAQVEYKEYRTVIDGQPVTVLVKDGDTLIIADRMIAIDILNIEGMLLSFIPMQFKPFDCTINL